MKLHQRLVLGNRYYVVSVLILAVILFLGGLSIHEVFSGDQAMFLVYSKDIASGAILYRDIWDIKQPAIFIFYLAAGLLFGFDEVGIHLFEIFYWFGLAGIMIIGLRKYFIKPIFALITPLFTIAIYYSVSGSWHLTQVEGLVSFPIFLSLWFCQKFLENPSKKSLLFLSGIFGSFVILFKLMLIGIPIFFWILLLGYCYFALSITNRKEIFSMIMFVVLGILLPLVLVVFYFFIYDSVPVLWYTTFVFPYLAAVASSETIRAQILKDGLIWFAKSYFPVILLTSVFLLLQARSFFMGWRQKTQILVKEHFLFLGLATWCFSGFLLIIIQRLSWWEYHYSLLMLPLGILAVKGVEAVFIEIDINFKLHWKTLAQLFFILIVFLSFTPVARRLSHKMQLYSQVKTIKIGQKEITISGEYLDNYNAIASETKFLTRENRHSKIFVISNPLYYYLSDSSPAFSTNGWMPELFTDTEWSKLNREMSKKMPRYIFLGKNNVPMIREKNPKFMNLIKKNYFIYRTSDRGLVYKRNHVAY